LGILLGSFFRKKAIDGNLRKFLHGQKGSINWISENAPPRNSIMKISYEMSYFFGRHPVESRAVMGLEPRFCWRRFFTYAPGPLIVPQNNENFRMAREGTAFF
jgi:hypothetical protein